MKLRSPASLSLALPVSPFLAALSVCLPYAANNLAQLELAAIAWVTGLALGVAALLSLLLWWIIGSFARAAICATAAIYGAFILPQALIAAGRPDWVIDVALLAVCALVVWLVVRARRASSDYRFAHLICNAILFGLLVVPVIDLVRDLRGGAISRAEAVALFPDLPDAAVADPAAQPDVWHLVMDRYAGQATLKDVYGFDNSAFLDALRQRGFSVAGEAAANYQRTAQSLASTLNLDFLEEMDDHPGVVGNDLVPLYRTISESRVARFFDDAGYRLVQVAPWWEPTRRSPYADAYISYHDMPDFLRLVLEKSMPGWAASRFGLSDARLDQCRRLQHQFAGMAALADEKNIGPKYVFAHLLLPHPPFVMTADGHCKSREKAAALPRRQNYLDQVIYANGQLLDLIDRINAGPRPAVILLQADEGPWPEALAGNEAELGLDVTDADWDEASAAQLREKMLILMAVKGATPGDLALAPRATPVNLYRQLLNRYFGQNLPLLPDRSFIFRDRDQVQDYLDVTDKIR